MLETERRQSWNRRGVAETRPWVPGSQATGGSTDDGRFLTASCDFTPGELCLRNPGSNPVGSAVPDSMQPATVCSHASGTA